LSSLFLTRSEEDGHGLGMRRADNAMGAVVKNA
jgi:hypothetical protein